MSFVFAKAELEGREVELSLQDRDWIKPVLVFGPPRKTDRFVEYIKLTNSLRGTEEKAYVVIEPKVAELQENFFTMLAETVAEGARVVIVLSSVSGARPKQLQALFSSAGVKIILGASCYEMLWLPQLLSSRVRQFSLVTLEDSACVIDYGAREAGPFAVIKAQLFAPLPQAADKKFQTVSAEMLRSMLSVFDHELVS